MTIRRPAIVDVVATANVYSGVTLHQAKAAVTRILDPTDGLTGRVNALGLQEWGRGRDRILRRLTGYTHRRSILGGGPIVLDTTRYRVIRHRAHVLAAPGRVDKSPGRRRFLGPSLATVVIAHDTALDEEVTFVNYHLTAEVQAGGDYRRDRPLRVARHRREVARLERLIARQQAKGRTVYAMGDSNYHGLRLRRLTSAWATPKARALGGTHAGGSRQIDDVYGPGPAEVAIVRIPGDHDAVKTARTRRPAVVAR